MERIRCLLAKFIDPATAILVSRLGIMSPEGVISIRSRWRSATIAVRRQLVRLRRGEVIGYMARKR